MRGEPERMRDRILAAAILAADRGGLDGEAPTPFLLHGKYPRVPRDLPEELAPGMLLCVPRTEHLVIITGRHLRRIGERDREVDEDDRPTGTFYSVVFPEQKSGSWWLPRIRGDREYTVEQLRADGYKLISRRTVWEG